MDVSYILKEYFKKERSISDLADELNTYPNKIRRAILKTGKTLRNKSEAQTLALKTGRHKHPTKGIKRSDNVKEKISNAMALNWENLTDKERKKRSLQSKQQWESMSDDEKANLQKLAMRALKHTSRHGSRIEICLMNFLKSNKYIVSFHEKRILYNKKFEIDIFIPRMGIAIELDGPAHFFPVWGEETLAKRIEADKRKTDLILGSKLKLIRVKYFNSHVSQKLEREMCSKVLAVLKDTKFLKKNYIEIEV